MRMQILHETHTTFELNLCWALPLPVLAHTDEQKKKRKKKQTLGYTMQRKRTVGWKCIKHVWILYSSCSNMNNWWNIMDMRWETLLSFLLVQVSWEGIVVRLNSFSPGHSDTSRPLFLLESWITMGEWGWDSGWKLIIWMFVNRLRTGTRSGCWSWRI